MTPDMKQTEKDIKNPEEHRQYTVSISEEDRKRSFEIEDERWKLKYQMRDWLILLLLVAITVGWNLLVYFNEAGIR